MNKNLEIDIKTIKKAKRAFKEEKFNRIQKPNQNLNKISKNENFCEKKFGKSEFFKQK